MVKQFIRGRVALSIILMMLIPLCASAQYYSWGSDALNLSWSKIKQDSVSVVYPTEVDPLARRVLHYINAVQSDIYHGYEYPPLNLPFVLHTQNFSSNALVMWMPKRIDFLTTPSTENISMLWTKQLVAHEYRHAVQYNTLSKGLIKPLHFLLGQQGAVVGLLYLPLFAIEGDAVWMETQMSTFGRGLQPSFTMHYRAVGREYFESKRLDKWMCGSFKEYIPDHYSFGYQVVAYSYTRYDKYLWSRVAEQGTKSIIDPWFISRALKKWYGTNKSGLINDAYDNLYNHFETLPKRENSMEVISKIDTKNYTTYAYPQIIDGGDVVAVKRDFDRTRRIVRVDANTLEETKLKYVGQLSTPLSYDKGRLWWSEYRESKLFEEKVNSKICYLELDSNRKPKSIKGIGNALYPTPMGDKLSYVEYDYRGFYSIVLCTIDKDMRLTEQQRMQLPSPTEIHGLAWDDKSGGLFFIATDDSGMWIGEADIERGEYRQLREGAYITISNLRAGGGELYFGSIESGYDEIHRIDLATGKEYRVTESKYGSFAPSSSVGNLLYATTYDRYGYHLSRVKKGDVDQKVEAKSVPQNIVNPKTVKWDVLNLDTVSYTAADSLESQSSNRRRKYNKSLKLVDIHSWFPFSFDPTNVTFEQVLDITWGATLLTQNLLSNTDGFFSYGYSASQGSVVKGELTSEILGVNLSVSGSYGGDQLDYLQGDIYTVDGSAGYLRSDLPLNKEFYTVGASLSLPLIFDCGYNIRRLSAWSSWSYNNGLVADLDNVYIDKDGKKVIYIKEGVHAMSFGASYSNWVRSALRDYYSPLSYSLLAAYTISPNDRNFKDLISLYGSITARPFRHQLYLLAQCNYQTSVGGVTANGVESNLFKSVRVLPTGFTSSDINNDNYLAGSLTLSSPIWSPEGGIDGLIYFKRICLDVSYAAARFDWWGVGNNTEFIYSYGGSMAFDLNLFRMPDASTFTARFGIYAPSKGGLSYQFGIDLPF